MGCATGVVKYFVFFANLIFALAGLALVIIGVLYKVKFGEVTEALPADFGLAPILSIIIGAVVFVTAFLGCCGAVKESPCMLTTYSIILLTIFILQVAIGVYAFLKIKDEKQFRETVYIELKKPFDRYDERESSRELVDVIQKLLQCCGFENYRDVERNGRLPSSCCKSNGDTCSSTDYVNFFHTPCFPAANNFLQNSSQLIGGVAIGIAAIEFFCCGFEGPDSSFKWANGSLPTSCCYKEYAVCYIKDQETYKHDDCFTQVYDFFHTSSNVIGGSAIGIAAFELIGAFFGLCLASSIKNQYRRSRYA